METKFEEIKKCIYKELEKPCIISLFDVSYDSTAIQILFSNRCLCAYEHVFRPTDPVSSFWFNESGKTIKIKGVLTYKDSLDNQIRCVKLMKKCKEKHPYLMAISPFIDNTFIASMCSDDNQINLVILDQQFDILYEINLIRGCGYGEFTDINYIIYQDGLLAIKSGYLVYLLSISI